MPVYVSLRETDQVKQNFAINQLVENSFARRVELSAATTFFVNSSTGADTNSGLSASTAFATLQGAYNAIVSGYDFRGQAVTIQAASGAYTAGLNLSSPWTGGGTLTLDLGGGSVTSSTTHTIQSNCGLPGIFTIQNGTIACSVSGASCIANLSPGSISLGTGLTFGTTVASGHHIFSNGAGAIINVFVNYTISGGSNTHYAVNSLGLIRGGFGSTVTITGSPTFNIFAFATRLGLIDIESMTYSGAVTGTRYSADTNAAIFTAGGGANYFPGTIAGSTVTGGQYA